jgi:hypothetical protein
MREDGRWYQSDGSRGGNMWSDSRYVMRITLIILGHESIVRHKRRDASKEEDLGVEDVSQ